MVTTALSRIVKDELRHFAFYFNQSRIRFATARRASSDFTRMRNICRRAINHKSILIQLAYIGHQL
jgi:hypothetical protein